MKFFFCSIAVSLAIVTLPARVFPQSNLNLSSCDDYLDLAAIYKENMNYSKAISLLEPLLDHESPYSLEKFLGKLYYLNGDIVKSYHLLKNIKDKDWETFLYLGLVLEELGKKKAAIQNYLKSAELKKTSVALYRLAKIYYGMAMYPEAAKYFQEVIAQDASFRLANHYLGNCLFKMNEYERAYTYASKGMNFYPQNEQAKKQYIELKSKLPETFFLNLKRTLTKTREAVKLMFYRRQQNAPLIKVGIARDITKIILRCGGDFAVTDAVKRFDGNKDKFYMLVINNGAVFLRDYATGIVYGKFKPPLNLTSENYPFYVLDVLFGNGNFWHKKIDRTYRGDLRILRVNNELSLINILSIEEYLYGVLPSEIPYSSPQEALKSQAVSARTLAIRSLGKHKNDGFDVCADVHCQVYQGLSVENTTTNKAVDATRGEILVYNEKPIESFYHANCGGCLRTEAFGKLEYLTNKFDSKNSSAENKKVYLSPYTEERWFIDKPETYCSDAKESFRWQRVYDEEDFLFAFGYDLKSLRSVFPTKKGECFHYDALKIMTDQQNILLQGDLNIREYFDRLRSNAFKIELGVSRKKEPKMLFIWGAGFGHGGGLCQEGAISMSQRNSTYEEILKHYYPKSKIKKEY